MDKQEESAISKLPSFSINKQVLSMGDDDITAYIRENFHSSLLALIPQKDDQDIRDYLKSLAMYVPVQAALSKVEQEAKHIITFLKKCGVKNP